MKIDVTADDIAQGKRFDIHCCPVALALRRATGRTFTVIGPYCYEPPRTDDGHLYYLPRDVLEWVAKFDLEGHKDRTSLEPFTFEMPDLT